MGLAEAFLLASGLAYFYALALPDPCTHTLSKAQERVLFLALGVAVILSLVLRLRVVYLLLGVVYVSAAGSSYLGHMQWRVKWKEGASDAAQMCMWAWDLAISITFLYLSLG